MSLRIEMKCPTARKSVFIPFALFEWFSFIERKYFPFSSTILLLVFRQIIILSFSKSFAKSYCREREVHENENIKLSRHIIYPLILLLLFPSPILYFQFPSVFFLSQVFNFILYSIIFFFIIQILMWLNLNFPGEVNVIAIFEITVKHGCLIWKLPDFQNQSFKTSYSKIFFIFVYSVTSSCTLNKWFFLLKFISHTIDGSRRSTEIYKLLDVKSP